MSVVPGTSAAIWPRRVVQRVWASSGWPLSSGRSVPRLWQNRSIAMLNAAERYARQIVGSWADGVYFGEAVLDDDGFDKTNIVIRAQVTKRGSDVMVDLTESD